MNKCTKIQKEHIFITDYFASLNQRHDTSIYLIEEALNSGALVWQTELKDITFLDGKVLIKSFALAKIKSSESENLIEKDFSQVKEFIFDCNLERRSQKVKETVIWIRKDPPIEENYTQACQLLKLIENQVTLINDPAALLFCDEKLFALNFPELIPRTLVTSEFEELERFLAEQKKVVFKPIGGKAGEGILVLEKEDKNLRSIFEIIQRGNKHSKIIVQEYLTAISEGDKRVFLLDGKPLAALSRIPPKDDHRANMAAGGSIQAAKISEEEWKACSRIGLFLQKYGLPLAGLDLIGGKVTEINLTSPTCLREISLFDGKNYAREIITWSNE